MEPNPNFPQDFDVQKAMELAASPMGQQLLSLLRQNGGAELQQAIERASSGDYAAAKESLSGLLASPEIQKLLRSMGR